MYLIQKLLYLSRSLSFKHILSHSFSLSLAGGGTRCWSLGVPGLWPSPYPCVLPDLEREGYGDRLRVEHSLSCSYPRWLLRQYSLALCPLFLSSYFFHLLFFTSFNHIILLIKHCHTYTLSHSLIHVHSAVQLTARDQYEQCYENGLCRGWHTYTSQQETVLHVLC